MSPYEITHAGRLGRALERGAGPGLAAAGHRTYPKAVWLNPTPERYWTIRHRSASCRARFPEAHVPADARRHRPRHAGTRALAYAMFIIRGRRILRACPSYLHRTHSRSIDDAEDDEVSRSAAPWRFWRWAGSRASPVPTRGGGHGGGWGAGSRRRHGRRHDGPGDDERYDANKDGKITQAEIDQNRTQWHGEFDADKNAHAVARRVPAAVAEGQGRDDGARVPVLRRDGNGQVTLEEYQGPMADMVANRDRNGDGALSQDDRAGAARAKAWATAGARERTTTRRGPETVRTLIATRPGRAPRAAFHLSSSQFARAVAMLRRYPEGMRHG